MNPHELVTMRKLLNKSQNELSQLLGVSLKAVQSYEQGWRNIPAHVERQVYFLMAMRQNANKEVKRCWEIKRCPPKRKEKCPAWELKAGHLCWFINGTLCEGGKQRSWKAKIEICRQCKVFQLLVQRDNPK